MTATTRRVRDFLILGAGPAGAAAAAYLARAGADVLLAHRRENKPVARIESLAPGIGSRLARIGVPKEALTGRAVRSSGSVSVWDTTREIVQDYMLSPHGPAWNVDRSSFDPWLRSTAHEAGAEIVSARRIDWDGGTGATLDGVPVHATTCLIATGAVSPKLPKRVQPDDQLISITGHRSRRLSAIEDGRLHIEAVPDGWWYALLGPEGRVGFGFLTDRTCLKGRSVKELWTHAAETSHLIRRFTPEAVDTESLRAAPAPCAKSSLSPTPNVYRIGSALASYDPLTGRGVLEAIRSALDVAEHLIAGQTDTALLARRLDQGYAAYLGERHGFYHRATRRFDMGFWRRRLGAGTSRSSDQAGRG